MALGKKFLAVLFSLFLSTSLLAQAPPTLGGAAAATVRIPSHGCSATIISTSPGRTFLLGCGHGYEGDEIKQDQFGRKHRTGRKMRDVPMTLDIPSAHPTTKRPVKITLIAVDYKLDLSLVQVDEGPLDYIAPVAPSNYQLGKNFVAAGYDHMEFPPKQVSTHIIRKGTNEAGAGIWWTREPPIPGRSGGGLIDVDCGCLVGVCEAYETRPPYQGMYINLDSIHEFLNQHWPLFARPPPQHVEVPVSPTPQVITDIQIPKEIRIYNKSGSQCWACALETAARYLKIERLYDLTAIYKHSGDYWPTERILNSRGVRHKSTKPGCKDKTIFVESIHMGLPVAFGVRGTHMMLMTGIDDKKVRILANSTDTEIHEENLQDILDEWDGWAVVLYPDAKDKAPQQLPIKKSPSSPLEYQYQDVGPVIQYPQQQSPPQIIYQQPYYVPRQQPICLPGGG